MMRHHHSLGRESLITGLIGATAVAVWFLVMDIMFAEPFATPSILGQVILFGRGLPETGAVDWAAVAAYSGLHVAAFLVFGALLTKLVFLGDRFGIARFALLMLLFAFEFVFSGVTTMFFAGTRGLFPIWSVLAANTLAAIGMSWYLFQNHPAFRRGLEREPLGAAPDPVATGDVRR